MSQLAKPAAGRRAPRLLLAISSVLVLSAASLAWASASAAVAWLLAVALGLAAAAVAWELHRAAVERAALQERVAHQAERLARFAAAQWRFVDRLAHEIKTPLTIVLNVTELLLRGSEDAVAVRGHARILADYTLHFSDLIEGFLRLDDPSSLADTSHLTPVHVHELVVEAVRRSQSLAVGRGVHLAVTIVETGGDQDGLETLGNGALLVAMVEGVVRHAVGLSWRGARVEVEVRTAGDSIRLGVRHHGLALAARDLESVFEWFAAPAAAGQPANGSSGALAIGKRIVEHHRGTIGLHNHAEGGGEFVVTLPRLRGDGPPPPGGRGLASPFVGSA